MEGQMWFLKCQLLPGTSMQLVGTRAELAGYRKAWRDGREGWLVHDSKSPLDEFSEYMVPMSNIIGMKLFTNNLS